MLIDTVVNDFYLLAVGVAAVGGFILSVYQQFHIRKLKARIYSLERINIANPKNPNKDPGKRGSYD